VTQRDDGDWTDRTSDDGPPRTANDIANDWAGEVFTDPVLDPADQLRLALGMLDLLDDYQVTCEIGFAVQLVI
jgi:hypothetical protein